MEADETMTILLAYFGIPTGKYKCRVLEKGCNHCNIKKFEIQTEAMHNSLKGPQLYSLVKCNN